MSFSHSLLIIAAGLSLGTIGAQAQVRRHYVEPPPEIYSSPLPAVPDVDTTGSFRDAPPVIVDPRLAMQPPQVPRRNGCSTTTYMTGEMMDQQVRVHRC
jgi:hypothetical protein